ncbi:MAG: AraC family transcriptional regulator [Paludibacteraceae bacterium]|nr:AraC family transcriptional regulator [Paludibacteraceae bacterium]
MYKSEYIVVFDSLSELASEHADVNDPLLIFCRKGKLMLDLSEQSFRLGSGDLILCPIGWEVGNFMMSNDFEGNIYLVRKQAFDALFQQFVHVETNIWEKYRYLQNNPLIHLDERQLRLRDALENIRRIYMEDTDNPYRDSVIGIFLQVAVYEMLTWLDKQVKNEYNANHDVPRMSRKDQLAGDFVKMVVEQKGKQRLVSWYANQLCVTPKYLSACVKEKMNRSAHEYIDEVLLAEIRHRLQYTDATIKQLTVMFNFPSQSFFGKYIKQHTGMTPMALRRMLREQK